MLKHVIKGFLALLVAVLVTTLTAVPVLAFEGRAGIKTVVDGEEVINDDLYIVGKSISVDGTIKGDVIAIGSTVTVNGIVNGSVMAIAETVTINGNVGHAVRAVGATININGHIDGDLVAVGSNVNVDSSAEIGRDAVVFAGLSKIDGHVGGEIKGISIGGIKSFIEDISGIFGAIVEQNGELAVGIRDNFEYVSTNVATFVPIAYAEDMAISEGLKAAASATETDLGSKIGGKVIAFLMTLIVGIVIILITPERMILITDAIKSNPWGSLGWGTLILFFAPLIILGVLITILGIPLGVFGLIIYAAAIYFSGIFISLLIGRWIIGYFANVEGRGIMIGAFALGLAILTVLKLIPFLGFIIGLATLLVGMGAIVVYKLKQSGWYLARRES